LYLLILIPHYADWLKTAKSPFSSFWWCLLISYSLFSTWSPADSSKFGNVSITVMTSAITILVVCLWQIASNNCCDYD
ncbi:hypothetical protein PMAYCL1PPCAC_08920, partial [Pristionchus mayeri]